MKNKTGRRNFIRNFSAGSLVATAIPSSLFAKEKQETFGQTNNDKQSSSKHIYNGTYTGEYLTRVAFPIGGIGAGMFCMEGTGAISHMSVRNKPDVFNEPGMFAAIYIKGSGAKILEGPVPAWKKFGQPGSGNGAAGAITGLPHFHKAEFKARFPFGFIDLTDSELPISVVVTG